MRKINRTLRRARRGFSLLEVLFAVLILGVLAAVAIPMYNSTKADAEQKTCLSNLRAMASAESKYKLENGAYTTTATNLIGNGLGEVPKCPKGDTYTLTLTGTSITVACPNAAHSATNTVTLQ
jgi:prepilin-type N-terminal cleavage/methylation domain-containing protein